MLCYNTHNTLEIPVIRFKITSVTRKSSSEIDTIHYIYEIGERKGVRTKGAEWEEIEFMCELEDSPAIQVANIAGNVALFNNPKLILNDPALFGTYKVGDMIEFMPNRTEA
jgi:hypothetical protein